VLLLIGLVFSGDISNLLEPGLDPHRAWRILSKIRANHRPVISLQRSEHN
jgi:hypothetical protein